MVQWANLQQIGKFDAIVATLTCEKSGDLHLVEPGLTARWQAGRLAVLPSNRQNLGKA